MIELKIDFSEVLQLADDLHVAADQVPFAVARTMNDELFKAREAVVTEFQNKMNVRNPNFPSAVLRVQTASKQNLSGAIVEQSPSHILGDHDQGATREAAGHRFAVPSTEYAKDKMTQRGLRQDARLHNILQRGKRAVRIVGNKVFIAKRGQKGLRYAFTLARSVQIKRDVDLTGAFVRSFSTFYDKLEANLLRAMKTRFN
jgi:hypothetical protein